MKKTLILALAAIAAPAFAGQESIVYVAPTPTPAPAPCPITWEVGAFYGFANHDIYKGGYCKDIDIYGADLTAVYALDDSNSVNLRFGYAFGDENDPDSRNAGEKWEIDTHTFALMPGYRYTHAINDSWSAYIGANVGVANLSIKDHYRGDGDVWSEHDSAWGFAYSAEVGLRYEVCENCDIFAAYEFMGSTAKPSLYEGECKARNQSYNTIRVGVGLKF